MIQSPTVAAWAPHPGLMELVGGVNPVWIESKRTCTMPEWLCILVIATYA